MAVKAWEQTDIRFAFCFPDPYEIGMSRLSITIPYEIINNLPCALCERVYMPWVDMADALRTRGRDAWGAGLAAVVEDEACRLTDLYNAGQLPLRVTHNDTKINNVLFDEKSREALVVIDLDTAMPGLAGHDFGDAIRFAANFVEEDCPQADKAGVNLNIFWAFAEGFIKETAATLTEAEVNTLGISCFALIATVSYYEAQESF